MTPQSLDQLFTSEIHQNRLTVHRPNSCASLDFVPAPSTRKQALTDFRRREILAAAIKVFGKKGFADTSVDDIAAAAKIAKGTLYLYFRSKEDIYTTALNQAIDQLNALIAQRLATAKGLREKLSTLIATRLEFWIDQKSLYRLIITVGREQQHSRQTNDTLRAGHAYFVTILEEAIRTGEIKAQPIDDLAWAILDMIRGCNERRLDKLTINTPQQDAANITAIALQHLGLQA
jgi:AcrR family transcriptional regulator